MSGFPTQLLKKIGTLMMDSLTSANYKSLMLLTWHVIDIGVCDSQLVPGGGGLHREVPPAPAPQAQQQGEYT